MYQHPLWILWEQHALLITGKQDFKIAWLHPSHAMTQLRQAVNVTTMPYACRMRDAMALQMAGNGSSMAPVRTPNLVGDFLGQARTPRWLGDPYGVDEQGTRIMAPDRVSLPNIAGRSRCGNCLYSISPCNAPGFYCSVVSMGGRCPLPWPCLGFDASCSRDLCLRQT